MALNITLAVVGFLFLAGVVFWKLSNDSSKSVTAPTPTPTTGAGHGGHDDGHGHSNTAKAWWKWALIALLVGGVVAGGYYVYGCIYPVTKTGSGCSARGNIRLFAGRSTGWQASPLGCHLTPTIVSEGVLEYKTSEGKIVPWSNNMPDGDYVKWRLTSPEGVKTEFWYEY